MKGSLGFPNLGCLCARVPAEKGIGAEIGMTVNIFGVLISSTT